jgi:hypothetical protein
MSDTVIKTVGTTENDKEWNNFLAKKAEMSLYVQYTETNAPSGYQLSSTAKTTSKVTVGSFTKNSSGVYKPTSSALNISVTDTNTPNNGSQKSAAYSESYPVKATITYTLTKKDAGNSTLLKDATFNLSSAITTNNSNVSLSIADSTKTASTDSSGKITYTFNVTGTVSSNLTYYYYDLASLSGSAKTAAQNEIDANEHLYGSQTEAETAVKKDVQASIANQVSDLSNVVVTVTATETAAPSGYTLPSSPTTTSTVKLGTFSKGSSSTTYTASNTLSSSVTNKATDGNTATTKASKSYTYSIPVSLTITKEDETTKDVLSDAQFSVTSKATDNTGTITGGTENTQTVTTNSNGKATYSTTLSGAFNLETPEYTYYTDYSSLQGSALTAANNAINGTTVFKTQAEAQTAANNKLQELLTAKEQDLQDNISVIISAVETAAPEGYSLNSSSHTTSSLKPATFSVSGTKLTSSISDSMTITDKPKEGSFDTLESQSKTYNYTIPVNITLKKVDSATNSALSGATFNVLSKFGSGSYGNSVSKTTDSNGTFTASTNLTGTVIVTTPAYLYYSDYNSLVGTAKEKADSNIAAGNAYKNLADAQAAQAAELPSLVKAKLEDSISKQSIQAKATETKAPSGYKLDTTEHVSKQVTPGNYTLSGTTATYDTVTVDIGTVTNEPESAAVAEIAAITEEYSYNIPVNITLLKQDANTNAALQDAVFDITTKGATDTDFTRKQSVTTNEKGTASTTDTITGKFTITTKKYQYYVDYASLVSTVKADADAKIAAGTMYKDETSARAAQAASLPDLAKEYLTNNISSVAIQAKAVETTAPSGYTLDTTSHTSSKVKPSTYTLNDKVFTYDAVDLDIGTITNKPKEAKISTLAALTSQYTYSIPMEVTLTKKDETLPDVLKDAEYDLSTKTLKDKDFARNQKATTDENGVITVQDSINGAFTITTSEYKYYADYDSLVSTVKEEADKKIAANEVYKTKADAEAAQAASVPVLAKQYLNDNITSQPVQAKATETKAPAGYVLDEESHYSSEVKPSTYTLTDKAFTYDKVLLDIGTLTNTPKPAVVDDLEAQTKEYTFDIPVSVQLEKQDVDTQEALSGAEFHIVSKMTDSNNDGESDSSVDTAESDSATKNTEEDGTTSNVNTMNTSEKDAEDKSDAQSTDSTDTPSYETSAPFGSICKN